MTLFALPNGRRITLTLHTVGVQTDDRAIEANRPMTLCATSTDDFQLIHGCMRRRFADALPRPAGLPDVWVSDDAFYEGAPPDFFASSSRLDI